MAPRLVKYGLVVIIKCCWQIGDFGTEGTAHFIHYRTRFGLLVKFDLGLDARVFQVIFVKIFQFGIEFGALPTAQPGINSMQYFVGGRYLGDASQCRILDIINENAILAGMIAAQHNGILVLRDRIGEKR